MNVSINRIKKGLRGAVGSVLHGYPLRFDHTKKELIDVAFSRSSVPVSSFADLGGVWGIDGAYSFYVLEQYPVRRACLVDTDMTAGVRQKGRRYPVLELIEGNFGDHVVVERVGQVDAVILFDVLLHQVKPDWNEILEMYATRTQLCIVYNQQFIEGEKTVRLPDLGKEEYFKHVPMDADAPGYRNLFEQPYEIHPLHNKPNRDVHNVWQWGITDRDLIAVMERLGFEIMFQKNYGRFSRFRSFENHAFIFARAAS